MTAEPRLTKSSSVAPAYASCPKNLKGCSNETICVGARTKPYTKALSSTYWSDLPVFKRYATEAKRKGLSCSGFI